MHRVIIKDMFSWCSFSLICHKFTCDWIWNGKDCEMSMVLSCLLNLSSFKLELIVQWDCLYYIRGSYMRRMDTTTWVILLDILIRVSMYIRLELDISVAFFYYHVAPERSILPSYWGESCLIILLYSYCDTILI